MKTTTVIANLQKRIRTVGVRKVAERSKLSEPMVSRLAAGKSRMFLDQAVAIARAVDCEITVKPKGA